MPGFNPEDYDTVESRLRKFWEENPSATIKTQLVHTYNNGGVIIQATILIEDWLVAQGLAEEHPGDNVNRNCWVENCETSAIGRALANWKYSGDKRPSREEMEKASRGGDAATAPVAPARAAAPATPGKKPTNWNGMLWHRAKEAGLNSDTLAQERYGVKSSRELTAEQCKTLLDELKAQGQKQMEAAVNTVQAGFGTTEEPF